jgi:hypothetical protein
MDYAISARLPMLRDSEPRLYLLVLARFLHVKRKSFARKRAGRRSNLAEPMQRNGFKKH